MTHANIQSTSAHVIGEEAGRGECEQGLLWVWSKEQVSKPCARSVTERLRRVQRSEQDSCGDENREESRDGAGAGPTGPDGPFQELLSPILE